MNFLRPLKPIVKWIIESRIKKYIKNNMLNNESLLQWLAVAGDGEHTSWAYQFGNGESVVQYLMSCSDTAFKSSQKRKSLKNIPNTLLNSQTYLQTAILLWDAEKKGVTKSTPKFSFWQRIILWLKKRTELKLQFDKSCFQDENFVSTLEKSFPATANRIDERREKYLPHEMIKARLLATQIAHPKQDLVKITTPNNEKKKPNPSLPPHLAVLLNENISLSYDLSLADIHTHDTRHNNDVKNEADINEALIQNTSIDMHTDIFQKNKWTDNSIQEKYTDFGRGCAESEAFQMLAISPIFISLNEYRKNQKLTEVNPENFLITNAAREIFAKNVHAWSNSNGAKKLTDLENLPLGLYIENINNKFVLKYDKDYEAYQLATLSKDEVRLRIRFTDTDDNLFEQNIPTLNEKEITKETFLNIINQRKIKLSEQQLSYIEKWSQDNTLLSMKNSFSGITTKVSFHSRIFLALITMAYADKSNIFIKTMIDIFIKFDESDIVVKGNSLLKAFLARFLGDEKPCSYGELCTSFPGLHYLEIAFAPLLNSEDQIENLNRLITLNPEEIDYFFSSDGTFDRISSSMFYLLDFFKQRNIPLPSTLLKDGKINHIRNITDCISLAMTQENQSNYHIQAVFAAELPDNAILSKSKLKSGYGFVCEQMFFNDESSSFYLTQQFEDKFKGKLTDYSFIKEDEFSNIQFDPTSEDNFLFYRGLFLRYIATNVHPNHLEQALSIWTNYTSSPFSEFLTYRFHNNSKNVERLTTLNTTLAKQWEQIKQDVIKLPNKMASNTHSETNTDSTNNDNKKSKVIIVDKSCYEPDDIENLMNRLGLNNELRDYIKLQVQTINKARHQYDNHNPSELNNLIKKLPDNLSNKTITIIDCLILLREVHCRMFKEWLRLEQIIPVLIALKQDTLFQIDTSEGKTTIIQFIALLNALQGKKIDLLSHNEFLAKEAVDKLAPIASLLNLKIADWTYPPEQISHAAIFINDVSKSVIQGLKDELEENPASTMSDTKVNFARKADMVLADEGDGFFDIDASTTMQISESSTEENREATQPFVEFLNALNSIVRTNLIQDNHPNGKQQIFDYIQSHLDSKLKNNSVFNSLKNNKHLLLPWIKAAITAMTLVKGQDYIIQTDSSMIGKVQIVHKETTGCVDLNSHWSKGIHQCISAWENKKLEDKPINKKKFRQIFIPSVSKILKEGSVSTHMLKYSSHHLFTGSLGTGKVLEKIKKIMQTENVVIMPRAKRPEPEGIQWPKVPVNDDPTDEHTTTLYNRTYHFPPIIVNGGRTQHFAKLHEALRAIQENNKSCLVFFSTIEECKNFYNYLKTMKITQIQIMDDTHNNPIDNPKLRPPANVAIGNACKPGKITLATLAASRGMNFKNVDFSIRAKLLNSDRFSTQEDARVGRNGQFGVTYEIISAEELPDFQHAKDTPDWCSKEEANKLPTKYANFRFFTTQEQSKREAAQLQTWESLHSNNRRMGQT